VRGHGYTVPSEADLALTLASVLPVASARPAAIGAVAELHQVSSTFIR